MFTILLPCILDVVKVFIIKSLFKKLWLTFENNDNKKLFKHFDIFIVENFKKFRNMYNICILKQRQIMSYIFFVAIWEF